MLHPFPRKGGKRSGEKSEKPPLDNSSFLVLSSVKYVAFLSPPPPQEAFGWKAQNYM